jgi:hypothetical protein
VIKIGKLYKIVDYYSFIIDNDGFCIIVDIIKDKKDNDWNIIKYISKLGIHSSYQYMLESLIEL